LDRIGLVKRQSALNKLELYMDGANGKQLATMIKQQAKLIVVIVRHPPTRSFTQPRGAYTQVLGIKL
jgi:hypothetical protein